MPSNATLYDSDFYAWANEQAALLRAGRLSEADVENIAEEIESMGRSERTDQSAIGTARSLVEVALSAWVARV
jgi:hypothetical protein